MVYGMSAMTAVYAFNQRGVVIAVFCLHVENYVNTGFVKRYRVG